MFMSPVVCRRNLVGSPAVGRKRNGFSREDESHLLQSPTDCESNEVTNGNFIPEKNSINSITHTASSSSSQYHPPEVGFCLPNKIKTPVSQVRNQTIQSMAKYIRYKFNSLMSSEF